MPMKPTPLPPRAGLEHYAEPLDRRHAVHLLRRISFGAHFQEIDALIGLSAEAAVDALVDGEIDLPMPDAPLWINDPLPLNPQERDQYYETNQRWMLDYQAEWHKHLFFGGLRERMTLFWHNHFVTNTAKYRLAPYAYRYLTMLRTHALGNFKDFVRAIGLDPAMLLYLNSGQNRVGTPNENYARELLELFTMGPFDGQGHENYTQRDVEEIARALTGWYPNPHNLQVVHLAEGYDSGTKTFFGRTGPWGYDDVVDILFEERAAQIAAFVCRKLYRAFIYAVPDEALVAGLAQVFLDNDFELLPVLRALFQSAHFHDEHVIGAQIKSPAHLVVGFLRETEPNYFPPNFVLFRLNRSTRVLGQYLLNPPNVAGWRGHHNWLNTTTLQARWSTTESIIGVTRFFFVALAEYVLAALPEPIHPRAVQGVFTLPAALAEHLLAVPVELLDISAPAEDFAGDLINNPIDDGIINGPAHRRNLAKIFLAGRPWYEWDLYGNGATTMLRQYMNYLIRLPEFQLT